jgi:anti-sigma factor RsiW
MALGFGRRRDLVCREAVAMVADYLDDALPPRDHARLEHHLADCPHCREYVDQLRATIAATGRIEPEELPDDMVEELVALYRRWRA